MTTVQTPPAWARMPMELREMIATSLIDDYISQEGFGSLMHCLGPALYKDSPFQAADWDFPIRQALRCLDEEKTTAEKAEEAMKQQMEDRLKALANNLDEYVEGCYDPEYEEPKRGIVVVKDVIERVAKQVRVLGDVRKTLEVKHTLPEDEDPVDYFWKL